MNHLAAQSDLFSTDAYDRFQKFHRLNPQVFDLFERFALQAINSGKERYGARAILERVRWESSISMKGEDFKINNDYIPWLARLFAEVHPEHASFFEFRNRN